MGDFTVNKVINFRLIQNFKLFFIQRLQINQSDYVNFDVLCKLKNWNNIFVFWYALLKDKKEKEGCFLQSSLPWSPGGNYG